jgi:FHA domain-containing protein
VSRQACPGKHACRGRGYFLVAFRDAIAAVTVHPPERFVGATVAEAEMSFLHNLELRLEGLVEGVFNRAFKARVQPVELARKLAKEMESYKTVSVSRVYVPNEYTVYLSREDRRQFRDYESALLDELSGYLLEHAGRENLALLTRPKVTFETDKRLRMGEFGIQARLVKPAEDQLAEASQGDLGATMVYAAARVGRDEKDPAIAPKPVSRALLIADGKSFVIDRPRAVVGRSQRCDYVLSDPNVSRRHFELQLRGTDWYLVDLESTNGVRVNGRRVATSRLSPGDEIVAGTSSLRFEVD